MRKRLFGLFLLASLCLTPGLTPRSRAEIGVIDNVPAATLLLPYFEVDLSDSNGITTLFSVNSATATATLVHVTLWSDLGIPTFAFDIYLTGYDVQAVNLRDVFNGNLPVTASDGQDPSDSISNQGPISQDINFASCNGTLPFVQPELRAQEIAALRNAHTGQASALTNNQCAGRNFGDSIVRGYVTVDTVNQCTGLFTGVFPSSPGYFSQIATSQNALWGDYFLVNPAQNFAQGESLVSIEAAPGHFTPSDYTFYGRFSAVSGKDDREPLATNWAVPYDVGGSSSSGTDLLVWRDPARPVSPFNCSAVLPAPFPLNQTEIVVFDTEENPTVVTPTAGNEPFPLAAMRTHLSSIGLINLPVTPRSGWIRLNLNTTVAGSQLPAGISQSHVTVIRDSQGRFSGGHSGVQLDNASNPSTVPTGGR